MKDLLTNSGISAAIGETEAFLNGLGVERKSAVRMRLMLEEILLKYQERFGREQGFELTCGRRFRRSFIKLAVRGEPCDIVESDDSEYAILSRLLSSSGLTPVYSYVGGVNSVAFYPKRIKRSPAIRMVIAITAAIAAGFCMQLLPRETIGFIADMLLSPISDAYMGVLSGIAGPLIFLSVAWGIYSIGDTITLGRIGKKMLARFTVFTFLFTALAALFTLPLFTVTSAKSELDATGFLSIYEMLLDILPRNILQPLAEGNPLQIIVLAVVAGFSMLILSEKASAVAQLVEQLNCMALLIMEFISSFVPVFIFVSLTRMIMSGQLSMILRSYKLVLIVLGTNLLLLAVCTARVCIKEKLPPVKYFKKLLPTYLTGVTTASSAAAYTTNVECCREELGLDKKMVNFGIPLGQVVYMPGGAVLFFVAGLCMAEVYSVAITPAWIAMAFFVSVMLAIAAPPIPGGALTCYTILFMQLGIPAEAVLIVISLNVVLEFVATGSNLFCLQSELVLLSDRLDMLDKRILHR